MRVLVIEDETLSANRLMRLLKDIDDTIDIDGPLTQNDDVVEKLITDNDYDLIFSDIRLRQHLVFEAFQEVMPNAPVIFTTAYEEYALTAFSNNGIDYLLKPIDVEELAHAINKFKQLKKDKNNINEAEKLRSVSRELRCYRERILVSKGDELIPIRTRDILYLCKENNHVVAHTSNGATYFLYMTMNELEEQLSPDCFFRLNRQYIAHIDSIERISTFFLGKLVVHLKGSDNNQIVISKERSSLFKKWLDR